MAPKNATVPSNALMTPTIMLFFFFLLPLSLKQEYSPLDTQRSRNFW